MRSRSLTDSKCFPGSAPLHRRLRIQLGVVAALLVALGVALHFPLTPLEKQVSADGYPDDNKPEKHRNHLRLAS